LLSDERDELKLMKRCGSDQGRLECSSRNAARTHSRDLLRKFSLLTLQPWRAAPSCPPWLALAALLPVLKVGAEPPLVLTEVPVNVGESPGGCYSPGARIVLIRSPFDPKQLEVLSAGLYAAGSPVVSYDGRWVFFAGQRESKAQWQIYRTLATGRPWRLLTEMPGGAMSPAVLPGGEVIFASPVRELNRNGEPIPQLYALAPVGEPRRLTFSVAGATDPTLLADGRILFVSSQPQDGPTRSSGRALYTINNDGTEISAFACQHDTPVLLARPRLLAGGRVAFIASSFDGSLSGTRAEAVLMARPFQSRAQIFAGTAVRSVEPAGDADLLVCEQTSHSSGVVPSWGVFRVNGTNTNLRELLFSDPSWNVIEAIQMRSSVRPMGRLSNVDFSKSTGQTICLNINDTTYKDTNGKIPAASKVRVLARPAGGDVRVLGEIPVQTDGSFMAEVPSDVPLGFEALDDGGEVLRRVAPFIWVRPGENRSCIGCHAEHNRAPHNFRPLAVRCAVPRLRLDSAPPKPSIVTAK
jgi:hypothetical protein